MRSLSVIVRTCGRPWFLQRSLSCIAGQSARPAEVVIVNDGGHSSTIDGAVAAARNDGLKVSVVHNGSRKGRGGSLNIGVRAASSELLGFLDDDDTWDCRFVEKVVQAFDAAIATRGNEVGVVVRSIEVFEKPYGNGWKEVSRRPFNRALASVFLQELTVRNTFTNNAFIFSKRSFEEVGPYREDIPVLEDWEFNVRFLARFPIVVVPEALALYHKRPSQRGSDAQNTELWLHRQVRHRLRDDWLRADLKAGKIGLGQLSLLSEVQANLALRVMNRIARAFVR